MGMAEKSQKAKRSRKRMTARRLLLRPSLADGRTDERRPHPCVRRDGTSCDNNDEDDSESRERRSWGVPISEKEEEQTAGKIAQEILLRMTMATKEDDCLKAGL